SDIDVRVVAQESMIGIDTNLLVYAHRSAVPECNAAQAAFIAAANIPGGWGISVPTIAEFWSIVTHPSQAGGPSSGALATNFIDHLVTEGHGQIWVPALGFGRRLMRWAAYLKVRGAAVFDFQIALFPLELGAN